MQISQENSLEQTSQFIGHFVHIPVLLKYEAGQEFTHSLLYKTVLV